MDISENSIKLSTDDIEYLESFINNAVSKIVDRQSPKAIIEQINATYYDVLEDVLDIRAKIKYMKEQNIPNSNSMLIFIEETKLDVLENVLESFKFHLDKFISPRFPIPDKFFKTIL